MSYNLQDIEDYLQLNENTALDVASSILEKEINQQSFNGIIGGKNGIYKVNPSDFDSADEYYDEWIESHNKLYARDRNCNYEKSVHRIHKLLEDNYLRDYIKMYLVRTWLRKY